MKRILAGVLVFLSVSVWAQTPVTIAVDEANPPFMYVQDGSAAGVYPALFSEAFKRMGVPVKIVAIPWKRALTDAEAGRGAIGGLYKTAERLLQYDYSEPIMAEDLAVYYLRDRKFEFKSVKDLYGKRVGVIRAWSYGEEFDRAVKAGHIVVVEGHGDRRNFRNLAYGQLDAVVAVAESGRRALLEEKIDGVDQARTLLTSNKVHLAFAKTARQGKLLEKFNQTISVMKQDGAFDKLVRQELSR